MNRTINSFFVLLVLYLFIQCKSRNESHLTIGIASSVAAPLKEIVHQYEKETGEKTTIVKGASGKLTTQIIQGGGFNFLISADQSYPEYLFQKGFSLGPPIKYATGQLALITLQKNESMLHLDSLTSQVINHIAVANPEIAPYGMRAMELIRKHDNLFQLQSKLVYGENVSQVVQFVLTGHAEIGITAYSSFKNSPIENQLTYQLLNTDSTLNVDHYYVAIKTENKKVKELQDKFSAFLQNQQSKQILGKYGFL